MGAWGNGIYENDSAQDYLIGVWKRFAADVKKALSDDGYAEVTPVAVACLRGMVTRVPDIAFSVDAAQVDGWRDRYAARVASEADDDAPADPAAYLRANAPQAAAEFAGLAELIRATQAGGRSNDILKGGGPEAGKAT